MRRNWSVALVVCVLMGVSPASAGSPKEDCARLFPKGGGTVIHGTFVNLEPGEYVQLCRVVRIR